MLTYLTDPETKKREIMIDPGNLIIINEWDRPCMHLICRVMPNGKIFYANKKLRREYPELKKGTGWASIKDYGFVYNWMKKKYELINGSIVRYHDGKIRQWQGAKEFTYKDIINSSKWGD